MKKPTADPKSIAEKLKAWRTLHKLTQVAAAPKIGVPIGTYLDWEQGRATPRGLSLAALQKIIAQIP